MNIVFLTTSDAIYLPAFFDRVLRDFASQTRVVHIVPPLYKGQTVFRAFWRYYCTFGLRGVWSLMVLMAQAGYKIIGVIEVDGPAVGDPCVSRSAPPGELHRSAARRAETPQRNASRRVLADPRRRDHRQRGG